jgi:hypothetical protein
MGLGTRQSIATLPFSELVFTFATLELYEEHLLSAPIPRTQNQSSCSKPTGASPQSGTCTDAEMQKRASLEQLLRAVRLARVGLAQELSFYPDVVRAMEASLQPSTSAEVQARRRAWYTQRAELRRAVLGGDESSDEDGTAASIVAPAAARTLLHSVDNSTAVRPRPPRMHFVTYASEHGPGLQNLLLSAELAGITIEVCDYACISYVSKHQCLPAARSS